MAETDEKPKKIQELKSITEIEWQKGMQFTAKFDLPEVKELIMDEPAEFGGEGLGPNASRVLASAVGQCLSTALIFCLNKARIPVEGVKTEIETKIARNEDDLLRVQNIEVNMKLKLQDPSEVEKSQRCQELFQKYCIVTDSIRNGININVNVDIE
jgi:uncharacterized OsmC-like protein